MFPEKYSNDHFIRNRRSLNAIKEYIELPQFINIAFRPVRSAFGRAFYIKSDAARRNREYIVELDVRQDMVTFRNNNNNLRRNNFRRNDRNFKSNGDRQIPVNIKFSSIAATPYYLPNASTIDVLETAKERFATKSPTNSQLNIIATELRNLDDTRIEIEQLRSQSEPPKNPVEIPFLFRFDGCNDAPKLIYTNHCLTLLFLVILLNIKRKLIILF